MDKNGAKLHEKADGKDKMAIGKQTAESLKKTEQLVSKDFDGKEKTLNAKETLEKSTNNSAVRQSNSAEKKSMESKDNVENVAITDSVKNSRVKSSEKKGAESDDEQSPAAKKRPPSEEEQKMKENSEPMQADFAKTSHL